MQAPKLRFIPYIGGGLLVFGSEGSVVLADLTAPAVVVVSMWSRDAVRVGWHVLSAGEETALLGHLVSVFALGAQAEEDTGNEDNREAHDGGVGFPVLGLRVPATSG